MYKTFKTLFTIFLGILFFIPTFTASSAEKNKSSGYSKEVSAKLEEIKYLYKRGSLSIDEFKKAKRTLTQENKNKKELASLKDQSQPTKKIAILDVSKKDKKKKKNLFKGKKEKEVVNIKDLEELGVYQPIKEYPERMIKFFESKKCKKFFCYKSHAGTYLYKNFTRSKIWAQRKPGNMMKAMAMYEIFYLGKLKDDKKKLERYKKNWPNEYGFKKKIDEKAIRSLKGINKGRKKMRAALGMDMDLPIEDAIKRFWVLGEFLSLGESKKLDKLSPEMKKRSKLLESYKFNIASLKEKLKTEEEEIKIDN